MRSSRVYWLYAKECARWAAETKEAGRSRPVFRYGESLDKHRLVEGDVAKLAAQELPKRAPRLVGVGDDDAQDGAQSV